MTTIFGLNFHFDLAHLPLRRHNYSKNFTPYSKFVWLVVSFVTIEPFVLVFSSDTNFSNLKQAI